MTDLKEKQEEFLMIGIGEVLWDILPEGKQLGGAPANFAYHVNQLGNRGVVVSCVGKDEIGDELIAMLEKKSIPHQLHQDENYPTGTVSVEVNEEGLPSYAINENAAWDYLRLDKNHMNLAADADVVCYGTLAQRNTVSAESIQQFLLNTSSNCKRLFDINLRQNYYSKTTIQQLLEISNILKLNDEELLVVADYFHLFGSETEMLGQLQQIFNLDLIILTKGGDGSRLFSRTLGDSIFNGVSFDIVDTVGAGDSFAAAVVTGICREMSLQDCHLLATRLAAHVCQHSGATPSIPSLEKLL